MSDFQAGLIAAQDTIHIFVTVPKDCRKEAMALEQSIHEHVSPPFTIYWMKEGEEGWDWDPEMYCWVVPEAASFSGKAIWLPAKALTLQDLRGVWESRCDGLSVWEDPGRCIVFDGHALASVKWWPRVEQLKEMTYSQVQDLLARHECYDNAAGDMDFVTTWNSFYHHEERPDIWWRYYAKALEVREKTRPANLDKLYGEAQAKDSDICEHLQTLRKLATECQVVCEFGVRDGDSTVAFIIGAKHKVYSWDLAKTAKAALLQDLAGSKWEFNLGDSRLADIPECDMLFIDGEHRYETVAKELQQHTKVSKYIVLHDTEAYAEEGEMCVGPYHSRRGGFKGIMPAVQEFLSANRQWRKQRHYTNNNGLTILRRDGW